MPSSPVEEDGQLSSLRDLEALLQQSRLPAEHMVTVLGYGSGVFAQHDFVEPTIRQPQQSSLVHHEDEASSPSLIVPGRRTDRAPQNMVDLIVVVEDAYRFHRANLQVNPHHYYTSPSSMSTAPPWDESSSSAKELHRRATRAAWWQRHEVQPAWLSNWLRNPKVYFCVVDQEETTDGPRFSHRQPSAPLRPYKYGVIQADDLLDDLSDWTFLYVAGRLHKPTVQLPLMTSTPSAAVWTEKIQLSQSHRNLPAALAAALLLLQQSSHGRNHGEYSASTTAHREATTALASEAYQQVAALSYSGDFRMSLGTEDPRKVSKLVHSTGQLSRWQALYHPAVEQLRRDGILSVSSAVQPNSLPGNEQQRVVWTWDTSVAAVAHLGSNLPPRLRHLAPHPAALSAALASIVAPAARHQALKGLFTAGSLQTSLRYAARKISKGLWSSGR